VKQFEELLERFRTLTEEGQQIVEKERSAQPMFNAVRETVIEAIHLVTDLQMVLLVNRLEEQFEFE
jgi:hypothetical protein